MALCPCAPYAARKSGELEAGAIKSKRLGRRGFFGWRPDAVFE